MVTSYSRGHKTYYKNQEWRYCDNNEIDDGKRNCARCGKPPTPEGYDACVGYVEGVTSACCGHGVENPYVLIAMNVNPITVTFTGIGVNGNIISEIVPTVNESAISSKIFKTITAIVVNKI